MITKGAPGIGIKKNLGCHAATAKFELRNRKGGDSSYLTINRVHLSLEGREKGAGVSRKGAKERGHEDRAEREK